MMGIRRLTGLAGIVVVASLLLAACGGGGTTPPEENSEAYPAPGETIQAEPTLDAAYPAPGTNVAEPAQAQATAPAQPTQAPAAAQNASAFPDAQAYEWREVVFGLDTPIGMTNAGDGSKRLFVHEKAGTVRIIQNDQVVAEPFLDIRDRVGSTSSEQGLLGLAFPLDYAQSGFFFVNYTDRNGNTVISRFKVTDDPNRADSGSERVLLTQQQPYPNHNGGQLAFGPDGYLYIGLGDGGAAGDPRGNGQNLDTLLGKILRIDVRGSGYAVPADNPFQNGKTKHEVWAYGLRNPWRFSFDMRTNDLYIADVGQNQWEEIDFLPAGTPGGKNFGWDYMEASHAFEGEPPADVELVEPVFEYDHSLGCSVTGGYVYRGAMAEWQGIYLFGDYCSANVWGLLKTGERFEGKLLYENKNMAIPAFGQDEDGEVYMITMNGIVRRLVKK